MRSEVTIRVDGVSKRYRIGAREEPYRTLRDALTGAAGAPRRWLRGERRAPRTFWALRDVSFGMSDGEVLGVIGRNGAGKSTLLKILSRITPPTRGRVELHGRVGSLLEVGTGFHPELTGRENIFLNGAILGMRRAEILRRFDEIVAFAEIEEFLDTPIKRYSSGMYVRLAFAVAAHLEPEILLVDEVLAVGDGAFQRKCLGKMGDIASGGRTVVFVSHQLNQIRRLCDRVLWLRGGRVEAHGPAAEVIARYEGFLGAGDDAADDGQCFRRWRLGSGGHVLGDGAEPIRLQVDIELGAAIKAGHFGAAITDGDGRVVAGWGFDDLDLDAGSSELELVVDTLPLRPGAYGLLLSLFDRGNNLNGGRVVEVWHAVPPLVVDAPLRGHPQERWGGALNVAARLQRRSP